MELHNHSAFTAGTPHSWVCRSFSWFKGIASLHMSTDAVGFKYSLYVAPGQSVMIMEGLQGNSPTRLTSFDRCKRSMRAKPVEQILIPDKPSYVSYLLQKFSKSDSPLTGNEGIGVLATWDSGETRDFVSRHLSSHMSVTTSHSKGRSSVDGTLARGVLYGKMMYRPCPLFGIFGREKSFRESTN